MHRGSNFNDSHRNFSDLWQRLWESVVLNGVLFSRSSITHGKLLSKLFMFSAEIATDRRRKLVNQNWNPGIHWGFLFLSRPLWFANSWSHDIRDFRKLWLCSGAKSRQRCGEKGVNKAAGLRGRALPTKSIPHSTFPARLNTSSILDEGKTKQHSSKALPKVWLFFQSKKKPACVRPSKLCKDSFFF